MSNGRIHVYGIFDSKNVCLYVGHTARLRTRQYNHSRRFPGCEFRVLGEFQNDGLHLERSLIKQYKAIGQCVHNNNT
jgi:excinuclease UvrABC nuclease subunit